jgi:hypothetical protein
MRHHIWAVWQLSLDTCCAEFHRSRKTHGTDAAEHLSAHRRFIFPPPYFFLAVSLLRRERSSDLARILAFVSPTQAARGQQIWGLKHFIFPTLSTLPLLHPFPIPLPFPHPSLLPFLIPSPSPTLPSPLPLSPPPCPHPSLLPFPSPYWGSGGLLTPEIFLAPMQIAVREFWRVFS